MADKRCSSSAAGHSFPTAKVMNYFLIWSIPLTAITLPSSNNSCNTSMSMFLSSGICSAKVAGVCCLSDRLEESFQKIPFPKGGRKVSCSSNWCKCRTARSYARSFLRSSVAASGYGTRYRCSRNPAWHLCVSHIALCVPRTRWEDLQVAHFNPLSRVYYIWCLFAGDVTDDM